jgi:DNA-binding NarL/FixJ family response regulator
MNYLFAPESVAERQTIFRELGEAIGPDSRLEMFPDIVGFSARLRRFNNPEIIVMLAVGKEEMPGILSLLDLIRDAAVIIILSDEEKDTVTSAIRLRPKFIGSMDGDLGKIVSIVKKLIRKKIARERLQSTEKGTSGIVE